MCIRDRAIPGDRDRVHDLENFLELDWQDAPEQRSDQGEQQAVYPTAGGNVPVSYTHLATATPLGLPVEPEV